MAVSKRTWYTNKERKAEAAALGLDTKAKGWSAAADASLEAKGVKPRSAWIVDYRDKDRTRQTETFATKTEAEKRHAQVVVDMSRNMHVAPNKSITFNEAAALFIEACKGRKLERTTIQSYEFRDCTPPPTCRRVQAGHIRERGSLQTSGQTARDSLPGYGQAQLSDHGAENYHHAVGHLC